MNSASDFACAVPVAVVDAEDRSVALLGEIRIGDAGARVDHHARRPACAVVVRKAGLQFFADRAERTVAPVIDQQQRPGFQPPQREAGVRPPQPGTARGRPAPAAVSGDGFRDAVERADQHQQRPVAPFDEEMFIEDPALLHPDKAPAVETSAAVFRYEEIRP